MAISQSPSQQHPPFLQYRIARGLRWLRHFRGWRRCVEVLAPPTFDSSFIVNNNGTLFGGTTCSYIDRQVYLFGGYEAERIEAFLSLVPSNRHRTILDIGANVGTHSLAFARQFAQVHSFEPNPEVCERFLRNVALNRAANIALHRVGLGQTSTLSPFFSIDKLNFGLGTFLNVEQYDAPLRQIGVLKIENGDDYIANLGVEHIDAVKIDVQGFELEVLKGLQKALRRDRPVVWFEYGIGTKEQISDAAGIRQIFPYPVTLKSFALSHIGPWVRTKLVDVSDAGPLETGDYAVVPIES